MSNTTNTTNTTTNEKKEGNTMSTTANTTNTTTNEKKEGNTMSTTTAAAFTMTKPEFERVSYSAYIAFVHYVCEMDNADLEKKFADSLISLKNAGYSVPDCTAIINAVMGVKYAAKHDTFKCASIGTFRAALRGKFAAAENCNNVAFAVPKAPKAPKAKAPKVDKDVKKAVKDSPEYKALLEKFAAAKAAAEKQTISGQRDMIAKSDAAAKKSA